MNKLNRKLSRKLGRTTRLDLNTQTGKTTTAKAGVFGTLPGAAGNVAQYPAKVLTVDVTAYAGYADNKFLFDLLAMKRPRGTEADTWALMDNFLKSKDFKHPATYFATAAGEPMAWVYETDPASKTLFVAHLDTVHHESGHNPVMYDAGLALMYKEDGTPLGADDGAGVWMLTELMLAGVKGTFVFTVGEEKGGVGATFLSDNAKGFLSKFDRAIAFDRRGTTSVITVQGWGRCASESFAYELSDRLNSGSRRSGLFAPDDTGVYTDTAEFTGIIPECTNISIGYDREHSGMETLDVEFLFWLRDQCVKLDWETLPVVRDPKVVEDAWGWGVSSRTTEWHSTVSITSFTHMRDDEISSLVYDEPEAAYDLLCRLQGWLQADEGAVVEHAEEIEVKEASEFPCDECTTFSCHTCKFATGG